MRLPTTYQEYIHLSRYARWDYTLKRRETWDETVERYFNFFEGWLEEKHEYKLENGQKEELQNAVKDLKIMPSMRCLMTAGPALQKENIAGYNCSYIQVDSQRSFDEILYVLMNGTGVGFSVEEEYTTQLPAIPDELYDTETVIVVADSKLGWARAFKELISLLYGGHIPRWDVSKVRPAGAPLKTFGGRASGPDPLIDLFNFTVNTFKNAKGRKLHPIECHDIVCKIGEVVVSGGVRRSALLSLSDLYDDRMRHAKAGEWWKTDPQRALANNSVAYTHRPSMESFMQEWLALVMSKSGERGLFNREAAQWQASRFERRPNDAHYGTNPCSEIILHPHQFCNLTEAVCRYDDTEETLMKKV